MLKVIGARLLRLVGTLLAVTALTFFLLNLLPGDPVNSILPPEVPRDPELVEQVREEFRLDDPLAVRYVAWLGDAVQGDLGRSYVTDQEVTEIIGSRVPVTLELATMATLIALLVAVPIGILGGYREGRSVDKLTSVAAQVSLSIPSFITAIFLVWFFTVQNSFFDLPASGWNRLSDGLGANLRSAILPAIALSLTPMAIYTRLLRSDIIGTLREDFVLSARAKGLGDRYVLTRHALRPSSLSLITIIGIQIGILLGGTVVIEQVFALPGLGRRLLEAIYQRDIIVVQGITVFIAVMYVIINTIVDVVYSVIDPRIRRS